VPERFFSIYGLVLLASHWIAGSSANAFWSIPLSDRVSPLHLHLQVPKNLLPASNVFDTGPSKNGFFPVKLECPDNHSGVLRFYGYKPDVKGRNLYEMHFSKSQPIRFKGWVAENGERFRVFVDFDLLAPEFVEKKEKRVGLQVLGINLYEKICLGSKTEKSRYLDKLRQNRERFGLTENDLK
jgi:hypothetical protein